MEYNVLVFGNIIAPFFTSLILYLIFLYFLTSSRCRSKSSLYKYFSVYLLTFGIYLMGRPLQMLLGDHPIPLIINNIRVLFFALICVPYSLFATGLFIKDHERSKRKWLFGIGFLMGMIYCIFNVLGTNGAYLVFKIGEISVYDTLTPSLQPPFYAREVTIGVQVFLGIELSVITILKIIKERKQIFKKNLNSNKLFLFNAGILFYGVTFIIGTLTKQWWLYYSGSVCSAFLLVSGFLLDAKEVYMKLDKITPLIKEELIQNIAFPISNEDKIKNMFTILGKEYLFDTFIALKVDQDLSTNRIFDDYDEIMGIIKRKVDDKMNEENYLIIPFGYNYIGLCLTCLKLDDKDTLYLIKLAESLREEIENKTENTISIGIGRSYENLKKLKISYQEALNALDYAMHIGKNHVIHINDIQDSDNFIQQYPLNEKKELLADIKIGKIERIPELFNTYLSKLSIMQNGNVDIFKVRVNHFLSMFIDSVISVGGDEKRLSAILNKYFNSINNLQKEHDIREAMITIIKEISEIVASTRAKRSNNLVQKAVLFIENNYNEQIMIEDVAKEVNLSPSYFKHVIKNETGHSFIDYLTNTRMKNAKALLESKKDINITEISYRVGYQDSNYFSKVFKNIVGISPSEYRDKPAN